MSLRYVILELLSAEPMTGYELDRILDETFGYVWTAPHSQIYPTLRQMETEGLISGEVLHQGDRRRRRFTVREAGTEELRRWAAEPVAYTASRDPARVKASMLHLLPLDECESFFQAHMTHYQRRLLLYETRLGALVTRTSPILRARLKQLAPEEHSKLIAFKVSSYRGSIIQARAEIEWAELGLATVGSLREAESPMQPTAERAKGGAGPRT